MLLIRTTLSVKGCDIFLKKSIQYHRFMILSCAELREIRAECHKAVSEPSAAQITLSCFLLFLLYLHDHT